VRKIYGKKMRDLVDLCVKVDDLFEFKGSEDVAALALVSGDFQDEDGDRKAHLALVVMDDNEETWEMIKEVREGKLSADNNIWLYVCGLVYPVKAVSLGLMLEDFF